MASVLNTLAQLFTVTFVVTSMLAMGLSLTLAQITAPLRNLRLVILAMIANFLVVPAVAVLLTHLIPLEKDVQIGLVLFGTAAGAPFLPKLAQLAHAGVAFAVGLMTLLMVATVVYLPLVLPLVLPGVKVQVGKIALALFLEMLLPLAVGLAIQARYHEVATMLRPVFTTISSLSLAFLLVLLVGLNLSSVLGLLGTGAIAAIIMLVAIAVTTGYLLGGPEKATRQVLALGTGQRNLAATFVIAGSNFSQQPHVLVLLSAASLLCLLLLLPLAAEMGRRTPVPAAAVSSSFSSVA